MLDPLWWDFCDDDAEHSFDGRADYEVFPDIQPSIVCSEQQKSFRPAIRPHHCGKGGLSFALLEGGGG